MITAPQRVQIVRDVIIGASVGFLSSLIAMIVINMPLIVMGFSSIHSLYGYPVPAAILGVPLGVFLWLRKLTMKRGAVAGAGFYAIAAAIGLAVVLHARVAPGHPYAWGKMIFWPMLITIIFAASGAATGAATIVFRDKYGHRFESRPPAKSKPPRPRRLGEEPPPINL